MGELSSRAYSVAKGEPAATKSTLSKDRFEFADSCEDSGVVSIANVPIPREVMPPKPTTRAMLKSYDQLPHVHQYGHSRRHCTLRGRLVVQTSADPASAEATAV